jgi:hypothetical protein
MFNLNRDHEIKLERIMGSKWSRIPLDLAPCFLLPITIKYGRSMMMEIE